MNIILLGAPGAGKGTQAVRIAQKYNIPHISTGDIFRKNLKEGTPVGLKAKAFIDKGRLVPNDIVIEIVATRLQDADCKNGYLLDGFPRTLEQATALEKTATIDTVVNIDVDLDALMARLTGRRVCAKCGESFHITTYDKKECFKCGGEVIHRSDDKQETVKERLEIYVAQTQPLIEYYSAKNILKSVDGMKQIDEVFEQICKVLG